MTTPARYRREVEARPGAFRELLECLRISGLIFFHEKTPGAETTLPLGFKPAQVLTDEGHGGRRSLATGGHLSVGMVCTTP